MILHQTLYNMFPPSSFEPQSITPLTPQEFIQRILVPEAALMLIMEDTGQNRARAVQTMRESAGYGVAMFPDTSEGHEVGAGEDIVLERARARRREIEDEERVDALLRPEDSEDEDAYQTKGIKRPNLVSSGTATDIEETTTARRTMKRKKAGWCTDAESGPDGHVDIVTHKYTRAVSSGSALDPSPPQSSPPPLSPLQAEPIPRSTLTSSPELLAVTTGPESRGLRSKGKAAMGKPSSSSRRGFASAEVELGASSTVSNFRRSANGGNSSAAIGADDLRVIDGAGAPSSDRMAESMQGSGDDKGHREVPKLKPKPRRRIVKPKAPVDQGLVLSDSISSPTEQNQWRDSSVE
jgi:hypothetical protein